VELDDYNRIFTKIDELSQAISLKDPKSSPDAWRLDGLTFSAWLEMEKAMPSTIACLIPLCRALVGAELNEASFFYFLHYARTASKLTIPIVKCEGGMLCLPRVSIQRRQILRAYC